MTYELISSVALSSTTDTFTFSSLPSTYRDLVLTADNIFNNQNVSAIISIRVNGDSGNNYYYQTMSGSETAINRDQLNFSQIFLERTTFGDTRQAFLKADFADYSQTNKFKSIGVHYGMLATGFNSVSKTAAMWASTAAINSISVLCDSGNFAVGTQFTIWGIKG